MTWAPMRAGVLSGRQPNRGSSTNPSVGRQAPRLSLPFGEALPSQVVKVISETGPPKRDFQGVFPSTHGPYRLERTFHLQSSKSTFLMLSMQAIHRIDNIGNT